MQRMDREYGSWPRAARWEEKRKATEKIHVVNEDMPRVGVSEKDAGDRVK